MKKTMFALAVLMLTAPALASVDITCSAGPGPNDLTISFNNSEGDLVRAIALDVTLDTGEATICDVNCVNGDYIIYPGSISIDEDTGEVLDYGTCACDSSYAGTLGGIDTNGVTIEMGSLYAEGEPAPAQSGDLVILTLCGCVTGGTANVSIAENVIRGGVVMEDPALSPAVNLSGCSVSLPNCYVPTCWEAQDCPGQPLGDATCDGSVNIMDVLKVKTSWLQTYPAAGYNCCADFDHNCSVNIMDILKVKANWLATGLGGTGCQDCPATCP
jgi:hypothetical protein